MSLSSIGSSFLNSYQQLSSQLGSVSEQVGAGDLDNLPAAVVALSEIKLQAAAASLVLQTQSDLASDLLLQPRR